MREQLTLVINNTKKIDKDRNPNIITFIDLFAGMGGMRIGFEQAVAELGFLSECIFSSEIKTHAKAVYQCNFGEDYTHGDITQVNEKDMPDFDFLLAGFPCQAFSNAGKRLGFEDTRGTLFFDVARILKEKKPKGFLLENVEGLVTHNNGATLETILTVLDDLGYNVSTLYWMDRILGWLSHASGFISAEH